MFHNRRHAMIRGEYYDGVRQAYLSVNKLKQSGNLLIGSKREIHHLLTVGTKAMPNVIVGRKTESENVGVSILAQLFLCDCHSSKRNQQLVEKRRVVECVVESETRLVSAAGNGMRERVGV